MRLRTILVVTAAVTLSLALTATARAQEDVSTDWRVGYTQPIDSLSPIKGQFTSSYFVFNEVYDLLLNWRLADAGPDPEHSPVTRWESSEDGLVWTFYLRDDVKWSDGEPLTAEDIVFSYNLYKNVEENVLAGYVTYLDRVEKVDDYAVRITLTQPDARILSWFLPILPKHVWSTFTKKQLGDLSFNACCPTVGSGPFVVTKLDKKGTTILERNPYFYGGDGPVKRILMIKYGDKESMLRDLKLKQLDAAFVGDASWVVESRKDPDIKTYPVALPGFRSVGFNLCPPGGDAGGEGTCTGPGPDVDVKVVQDRAIRVALSWAIDREDLARTVFRGQASPGNGFISPFYQRYYQSFGGNPEVGYRYDPAKARQVLAEGGWDCPPGGVCVKDGVQAEFELLVRAEHREDQNMANRIKAWARDVGIAIDVSIITEDALNDRLYTTSPTDDEKYEPNFDAFLWGWGGDLPSPDFNFEVIECGSYWSDTFYCNPDYDKLAKGALSEVDDFEKRKELLHQAEEMMLRDAPYIVLVHDYEILATRDDTWSGWQVSPATENGDPFRVSWFQLQILEPGSKAAPSYAGAPVIIGILAGGVALIAGLAFWRRRRERSGPLELPEAPEPRGAAGRAR